jgi:hypothetical protein
MQTGVLWEVRSTGPGHAVHMLSLLLSIAGTADVTPWTRA